MQIPTFELFTLINTVYTVFDFYILVTSIDDVILNEYLRILACLYLFRSDDHFETESKCNLHRFLV